MLSKIRELRIAQGLTAEQLAVKAGTTHTTIYAIEAGGNVKLGLALRIANALGVPLSEILEEPNEQQAERGTN